MKRKAAFAVLLLGLCANAAAAPAALTLEPFVSGLASPTEVVQPDDASGRLFVTEQAGTIRIIRNGVLLPTPFLDISAANGGSVVAGGEQGLLGLAFDPDHARNGRFYVHYTRVRAGDPTGSDVVIERYTRSATHPDIADPASATLVLAVPHPDFPNHNGGKLAFGPDGYLYVAVGDGGGAGDTFRAAQSLDDLRGKILRIDVSGASGYAIPASNPFAVANPSAPARPEIWAYGLRNPWRFSFDRTTADVFIGDVGQDAWEEIDFQPAATGAVNYGWGILEGTHCFNPPTGCSLPGGTFPIIEYPHGADGFSVTGGFRYRGHALAALDGFYVYGDFASGRVWAAAPDSSGTWTATQVATSPNLSTFGEDASGELYVADLAGGTISRLTPAATTIPRAVNIATRGRVGTGEDVLIGGFIIGGSSKKTVVITGSGPSLADAGTTSVLADPKLTIVRSSDQAIIATNDDWADWPTAARIQDAGLAPSNARESAAMLTLEPGAYTAILSGANGEVGVGLVAVYELDHPEVPLIDIATRANVMTGDDVLIGGFVVQGNAPRTFAITATGPSLAAAGVANPLANPTLTLVRSSDQAIIATNDDWAGAANAADIEAAGFAPANARESAIMMTLAPGAYTAIVSDANGASGVGIVAVYEAGP